MKKRRKRSSSGGGSSWLATYSDLVTLLLCFFVLLFSFSTVDAQKFREIMNSFQGGTGVLEGGQTLDETAYETEENEEELEEKNEELEDIKNYLEKYTSENNLDDKIVMKYNERGLMIRTMDNVFFDSGKTDIKPESKKILMVIGNLLNKKELKEKQIKVEGHTDDVVMNSDQIPSNNWELSAIRATNVIRLFEDEIGIESDRISVSGYGPNRPIVPNDSKENRAQNRRVDITILKSEENKLEPK